MLGCVATDLALIIMNKYPDLSDMQNGDGFRPLKLLATRPSAFRSGKQVEMVEVYSIPL